MSQLPKRILFIASGFVGLVVLVACSVLLLVDINHYKPRLEAAASDALGMEVRIGGRLGMGFFPGFHISAQDGRILNDQGVILATAKRAEISIELFPLLRKALRLRRIELTQPTLSIERDSEGRLNVERLKRAGSLLGALNGASVSVSEMTIRYVDKRSRDTLEATGCTFAVSRMRFAGANGSDLAKRLSCQAEFGCAEIRTKALTVASLKGSVDGSAGIFKIEPITMRVFGGQAVGSLRADFLGSVPLYQISYSLPDFRIEEFLELLSPKKAAGAMDFSATLSMQGTTMSQIIQTAAGNLSLRGTNLELDGNDLDRSISRFRSSQNFHLVDVGAVFFAGPLGLAITKGYNFASLFQGAGGSSSIRTLVSDWSVERGVAQAKDVAMATPKNRIALQGGLDFVNERFDAVTIAVVDAGGCAIVRQSMSGSFAKPTVEKPHVLTSLAGPLLKLYSQTRGLLPAKQCEVFYSGSVAPPG